MSSQVSSPVRVRLRARQTETHTRLLEAGEHELRAVGHEALTIRTVAARAGVSPATAYTYLASKNHLFAELFLVYLLQEEPPVPPRGTPVTRVQVLTRWLGARLAAAPELAAAVTPALLSSDPDVERLRGRIGLTFVDLFRAALGEGVSEEVLDSLLLAFFGALLQAGMGVTGYAELGDRLDPVVATTLRGNR
ncbi:MAG: TetR/AcrR family transcriptional regulator [Marmoricola sp.]|nr:TetR/AcrR family transcriptional regulator [Marmoricola sp.]